MTLTLLSSHPIFIDGDPGDPIQTFSSNNSVCFKALEDLSLPDFIAAVELLLGCPERRDVFPLTGGDRRYGPTEVAGWRCCDLVGHQGWLWIPTSLGDTRAGHRSWKWCLNGSFYRNLTQTWEDILGLGCLSARCCHFHKPSLCQNLKTFAKWKGFGCGIRFSFEEISLGVADWSMHGGGQDE